MLPITVSEGPFVSEAVGESFECDGICFENVCPYHRNYLHIVAVSDHTDHDSSSREDKLEPSTTGKGNVLS